MQQVLNWLDAVPAGAFFAFFAAVLVVMHLAGMVWDRRRTARRVGRR